MKIKISILILTHNAPAYVKETLETLQLTRRDEETNFEIIVLDNASDQETRDVLIEQQKLGHIDKLRFSDENTLFAKGNNLAARMSDAEAQYLLLLNSDVRIKREDWLRFLYDKKRLGNFAVAAFGCCLTPSRADGYCFLIDRDLYLRIQLDENFPWYWGITKLQASVLSEHKSILAIVNHDKYLLHYGGKSGVVLLQDRNHGKHADQDMICSWFSQKRNAVRILDLDPFGSAVRKMIFAGKSMVKSTLSLFCNRDTTRC